MSKFDSLAGEKEFLHLNGKRSAALVELSKLKKALEALPKDNPPVRSFERIQARVESERDLLQNASKAISSYFCKMGGDPLNDSGFDDYCDTETNIIGEIEILRESYHDLLKVKGLLVSVPPKPEVTQSELIKAMETLAASTGKHAAATEAQAKAALHHHKVPEMPMPNFNPADTKNNPLA